MSNTNTLTKPRLSVKVQTLAVISAIAAAVILPQIFHIMGRISGLGTALGEAFLPMHLPILLVGLLAGPYAGAIAGALSPFVSFALTGMPGAALLPFMMIELFAYGLITGILRKINMPTLLKVIAAQVGGRAIRAVAIVAAFYLMGKTAVPISIIWTSIAAGVFGLVLQWVLLPLIAYRVENLKKYE